MIMNNENKKLPRIRKRRTDPRNKKNDDIKLLINKIKSEKKKKNKNFDKIKQVKILLVRIKNSNKPDKLESDLRELNKIEVSIKNYMKLKMKFY